VPKRIFAILYVSVISLTRCYKTTVFLHLLVDNSENKLQSETADFAAGAAASRTRPTIRVTFDSGLFPPLYENMTSSAKPEVHNVSHCLQRRTEPRSCKDIGKNEKSLKRDKKCLSRVNDSSTVYSGSRPIEVTTVSKSNSS